MPSPWAIPKRCRFVADILLREPDRWRTVIELQTLTGKSSSDRKLRELHRACPGLLEYRDIRDGKKRHREWRVSAEALVDPILRSRSSRTPPVASAGADRPSTPPEREAPAPRGLLFHVERDPTAVKR